MVSFGSRKGEAGSLSIYLMVVAFLLVGGFFAWLSVKAAPVEVAVVEEGPIENLATVVALDVFGTDPMAQAGMVIQLDRLGVQSLIGAEAFFVGVPNLMSPYLIKMSSGVVANGGVVENGATVSLTGMVHVRTDSVIDAWVASGGIGEGDRILAEFAESFFEASEVNVTAPPQPDDN